MECLGPTTAAALAARLGPAGHHGRGGALAARGRGHRAARLVPAAEPSPRPSPREGEVINLLSRSAGQPCAAVVRAAAAGAHPSPDARPAAPRDRGGLGRRLHALPVPLAARAPGHAAARARRRGAGDRPAARARAAGAGVGARRAAGAHQPATTPAISSSSASPARSRGAGCVSAPPAERRGRGPRPARGRRRAAPTRAAPLAFALRADLPMLLGRRRDDVDVTADLSPAARDVVDVSRSGTAPRSSPTSRAPPVSCRRRPRTRSGSWSRAAWSPATASPACARLLLPEEKRRRRGTRLRALRGGAARRLMPVGRWSLLRRRPHEPSDAERRAEAAARQLLRRYGRRAPRAARARGPRCRLARRCCALRRLEARGEIRGGRFVAGFVGEQFALPEAVEALRAVRRAPRRARAGRGRRRRSAEPRRHRHAGRARLAVLRSGDRLRATASRSRSATSAR